MTSSAKESSVASSTDRALAAAEIARLLREEEQARQPSGRPAEAPRLRPAPPSELPPPRPRRTAPIEVPPSQVPPSQVPPSQVPPSQVPPPRVPSPNVPHQQPVPPSRPRRGNPAWLIFVAVWAILSIFGRFAGEISSDSEDVPVTFPATTEPLSLDESTLVAESSLEPGTCIVWLPPGDSALVASVACAEAHQYEVFAIVEATGPSVDYPGPQETYDLGYDGCFEQFVDYVGEPYPESPWHIKVIPPTEPEWVEEGDRAATCLLYKPGPDGDVYSEGTARGSGRPSA